MVHSYAKLQTTPQAIQQNLNLTPEEFDKQFLAWIDKQYGTVVEHFDEWRSKLREMNAAADQKAWPAVLQMGPGIIGLYPQYVDEANPYELMAEAYHAQGDTKAEEAILTGYEHAGGQQPDTLKHLAALEKAAGQDSGAAATLERVTYIYPVKDEDLHKQLGDLLLAQKQYDGAIREYTVLVASNPVDKAGAEFNLAQAYFGAGQKDKAQDSVLAALEAAPGYRPAQKLLLQLQDPAAKSN